MQGRLSTSGFLLHGSSGPWEPWLEWLHLATDVVIILACLAILVAIGRLARSGARAPQRAALEVASRLAAIIESTNNAIIGKTPAGVIETWNPAAEQLYGYRAAEAVGRPASMLVPPDRIEENRVVLERAARGERVEPFNTVRLRKDGTRIDVSVSASPIRNAAGETVGISTITRDIAQQLRSERLHLAEALLSEVHHRVKNNLQVVCSLLKLQAEKVTDPEAQAAFRESQDRVRSIALLHERLHLSEDLGSVRMQQYADEVVETLVRASGPRDLSVHVDAGQVTLPMEAAVPLGLILNELVTNTLKHAFPGEDAGAPPTLRVTLREDGDEVELAVVDNGRGFERPPVPEPSRSLGMHLVATLARQLRGRIAFASEDGAACRVRFPRRAARGAA